MGGADGREPQVEGEGASFDVDVRGGGRTLRVEKGELWRFSAHGDWHDGRQECGPQGYRRFIPYVLDIRPEVEDAPYGCLVGKFKDKPGSGFRIGLVTVRRFREGGELEFSGNLRKKYAAQAHGHVSLTAQRLDEDVRWPRGPGAVWDLVRRTMDRTAGVGFIAGLVILLGCVLAFLPQGQDIVRAVSEDGPRAGDPGPGWRQFWFGVTLFVLSMQAWFWPRVIINFNYGSDRETWRPRLFLEWLPRVLGALPGAFAVFALIRSPARNTSFAVAVAVGAVIFFVWIVRRNDLWSRITRRRREDSSRTPPRVGRLWVLAGVALALVTMIAFSFDPVGIPRRLGPPAVVFLGVSLIITPVVIAIQAGASIRFPVLGFLLLLAAGLSLYIDNHRVGRRAWVAELPAAAPRQVDLATAYGAWRKTARAARDGTLPVILVASEGGASRAGYWTGEVLTALHHATGGRFTDNTFAISSVSGGSVGAVAYAAALQEGRENQALLESQVRAVTGEDALSPTLAGMLFPDLFQRFFPAPVFPDRAEALERSWEAAWRAGCADRPACDQERIRSSFLDIWRDLDQPQPTPAAWTPLVIVNGASEESGRRILTSKLRLTPRQVNASDFFVTAGLDIPASTAIHNGARFPYVSPAGTVVARDGETHGHVIDGGYFDPAGTEVIRELAYAIRAAAPAADRPRLKFVFVFVGYRATPKPGDNTIDPQTGAEVAGTATNRFLNELLAPLAGMLSSRDGHAQHLARNLAIDAIKDEFSRGDGYVPLLLCDNPNPRRGPRDFVMPMDWVLSDYAKGLMRAAVRKCPGNAVGIQRIQALWATPASPESSR